MNKKKNFVVDPILHRLNKGDKKGCWNFTEAEDSIFKVDCFIVKTLDFPAKELENLKSFGIPLKDELNGGTRFLYIELKDLLDF